jgi:hypothetical protein
MGGSVMLNVYTLHITAICPASRLPTLAQR